MSIKLVLEDETYKIIGACIQVHKKLGSGFSKAVYIEALVQELEKAAIPFEQQKKLAIYYDGVPLNKYHIAAIICYDQILIEIIAMKFLPSNIKYQVINYLKSTKKEVGLLVNFGGGSLKWQRFIQTPP